MWCSRQLLYGKMLEKDGIMGDVEFFELIFVTNVVYCLCKDNDIDYTSNAMINMIQVISYRREQKKEPPQGLFLQEQLFFEQFLGYIRLVNIRC